MFLKIFGKRASWITDSTLHIIILYHSIRVSNLQNRNWTCLPTVKFLFIENSIRGEISVVSHQHAKANNPLVPDYDYNSPVPTPISLTWMLIIYRV